MKKIFIFIGTFALPLNTLAHAGDHYQTVWSHLFSQPFHLLPLIGIVGLGVYIAVKSIHSKK